MTKRKVRVGVHKTTQRKVRVGVHKTTQRKVRVGVTRGSACARLARGVSALGPSLFVAARDLRTLGTLLSKESTPDRAGLARDVGKRSHTHIHT